MIILLTVIFIALLLIGIGIAIKTYDWESMGVTLATISGCVLLICAIAISVITGKLISLSRIDEKIALYESENAKIEAQIAETVTQYQQYEQEIFTEVSPDNAVTLVTLYPELKSDKLVSKQLEVYVENNEMIKSLKADEIYVKALKWWLYFGGE